MKAMGVTFGADEFHTPVYNDQTMESNVPGLYLAGVVVGGLKPINGLLKTRGYMQG